ncbi:AraC-like ligand-binding domain-containing protein [Streptomyces sp. NPDC003236]
MEKVFDSEDFPARDALAAWAEVTRRAVMPTAFRLVDIDTFDGWFKTMPLGSAQVSAMSYSSFCTLRTPDLIRASDPECLQIALPRSGSHVLEQNRSQVRAGPGQLLVFDSSRPFEGYADGEALLIQLPRALLPLPAHRVERLMTRALPADEGIGRLLGTFLTHLAEGDTGCTAQDATRLGSVGLDLVTVVLAHHLDRESDVPADTRQRALFLRVTSFVQLHLGDPALSTEGIAAAHHMSVRSLHRLFQQHGVSVRSWIRAQRMERCRRDLAEPMKRHLSIAAVANRWGFPRPADFTRAFRALHGITPSDYRDRAHSRWTDSGSPGRPGVGTTAPQPPDHHG